VAATLLLKGGAFPKLTFDLNLCSDTALTMSSSYSAMQASPDNIRTDLGIYQTQSVAHDGAAQQPRKSAVPDGPSNIGPSPASGAPRIRRRNRMITSCLECRRRKLKCDKSHPCANCTKFTRDCVFLAPALDSASQLKLTEIKEKMGSLERVLEQDVARNNARREAKTGGLASAQFGNYYEDVDFAPEPEDEKELEPTPMAVIDAVYDDDADDDLMDLGVQMGKLRLTDRIGGFFRPKMADEVGPLLLGYLAQTSLDVILRFTDICVAVRYTE